MTHVRMASLKLRALGNATNLPAGDLRAIEIWLALVGPKRDMTVLCDESLARIDRIYRETLNNIGSP